MKDQKELLKKCLVNDIPAIVFQGSDSCAVEILQAAENIYRKNGCSPEFLIDFHENVVENFRAYQLENSIATKLPDLTTSEKEAFYILQEKEEAYFPIHIKDFEQHLKDYGFTRTYENTTSYGKYLLLKEKDITEALTREAITEMEKSVKMDKPFYLYMSHYAVHTPYDDDKRFSQKYRGRYDEQLKTGLNENEAKYAALVEGMDKSLGDILDYLQKNPEVAQNTILLFMSDNGGQGLNNVRQGVANRDQNYPARGGKGSAFMGGVREPMMVYWPGVTKPNTECSQRVIIEDFYPTILDMAGVKKYTTHQVIDGVSFADVLKSPEKTKDRVLIWHFPNLWGESQNKEEGYGAYSAILKGDYHLIYTWETRQLRLYDVKKDIGEQNDLSQTMPDKVKELAAELSDYLRERDAQRPSLKSTGEVIPFPDEQ